MGIFLAFYIAIGMVIAGLVVREELSKDPTAIRVSGEVMYTLAVLLGVCLWPVMAWALIKRAIKKARNHSGVRHGER